MAENPMFDDCWRRIGVWGGETPRCEKLAQVVHCRNCDVFHDASRLVYEKEIPGEYRVEWTRALAEDKTEARAKLNSVIALRLGDEWVGLPSSVCKEIGQMREIRKLPHNKSKVLRGVINIGGEVHLCFSIGMLLGIKKSETQSRVDHVIYNRIVAVDWHTHRYVFPVTEVGGIYYYKDENLKPVPSTVSESSASYMTGIVELGDWSVGCLEPESLFAALERVVR